MHEEAGGHMPSAIPVAIREQMVRLREQGHSYREIGETLGQSRHSVRQIWKRWQAGGEGGLVPGYERCGHRGIKSARVVWRAAIYLKRLHPSWGGGIIRVHIQQRWQEHSIPSERTLQRWFVDAGVSSASTRPMAPARQRAQQVHQCWQVDAVSHQSMGNGASASWLSATDEASGALLESSVFPLWEF